MRPLTLLFGALTLFSVATQSAPARAQHFSPELQRLHGLCDKGDRGACVRFGILIGEHHERWVEWRRSHPEWWWWEH
jgi:hypothetical protein